MAVAQMKQRVFEEKERAKKVVSGGLDTAWIWCSEKIFRILGFVLWWFVYPVVSAYVWILEFLIDNARESYQAQGVVLILWQKLFSALALLQIAFCWVAAYIRHREQCIECSLNFVKKNQLSILSHEIPTEHFLMLIERLDSLLAPANAYVKDLTQALWPDNCGTHDHATNKKFECWVLDGSAIIEKFSNCPVAHTAELYKRVTQTRKRLYKK